MCARSRLSGECGYWGTITIIVSIVLFLGNSYAWTQTVVSPDELIELRNVHAESTSNVIVHDPIIMELRIAPADVTVLEDHSELRDSVDLYRGLRLTDNNFRLGGNSENARSCRAIGAARMGIETAGRSGSHITEYEFSFGLHALASGEVLQPYVVVNFYNLPIDEAGAVHTSTALSSRPVSSVAFRYAPAELPLAGSYAIRSGLIDLVDLGLDFSLDVAFAVEIMPLEWSDRGPVYNPNIFAIFTPTEAVTYGAILELPAELNEGGIALQPGIILRGRDDPTNVLALGVDEQGACVKPGKTVTVRLSQRNLQQTVDSYEAYLKYQTSRLEFVLGQYDPNSPYDVADPNCSPIHPWGPDPNNPKYIDLCASTSNPSGINNDADLVTLTFLAGTTEGPTWLRFRDEEIPAWPALFWGHNPPIPLNATREEAADVYIDGTPPDVTCPPNVTVQCLVDIPDPAASTSEFRAQGGWVLDWSEGFRPLSVTHTDAILQNGPGCPDDPYILERTYWIADCAGNTSDPCAHTITVIDDTPPQFDTFPGDPTVECTNPTDPNTTGEPTYSDNCSTVQMSYSDASVGNCGDTVTITRTWRIVDECGNSLSQDQIITVEDTTNPVFDTVPPDVTVECADPTDPIATGEPTGSDTCGNVTIIYSDESAPGCGNSETITRTWTVEDDCGNTTNHVQIVTVIDTTSPSFVHTPANITVQCSDSTAPADTDGPATATDACGMDPSAPISYTEVEDLSECNGTGTITRTWSALDACGNTSEYVQIITVIDSIAPTFEHSPVDITVECDTSTWPEDTDGPATATDNCGMHPIQPIDYNDEYYLEGCNFTGTIIRTWVAQDACGNTSGYVQTITVVDTTSPIFTHAPADVTVQCDGSILPEDTDGPATATDNCGTVGTTKALSYIDVDDLTYCNGTGIITRTWVAEDDCGNTAGHIQIITVIDTVAPTFTLTPTNTTVQCDDSILPVDTNGPATATDNCGMDPNTPISYTDVDDLSGCNGTGTITRTWTALDACGNTTEDVQIITVIDTIAPSFTLTPANITVQCDDSKLPVDTNGPATATDNCGMDPNTPISYADVDDLSGCNGTGTITRTWTALDVCGNTTEYVQIITIIDTIAPTFTATPTNVTVQCDDSIDPADTNGPATASDNCGMNPNTPISHADVDDLSGCNGTGTITRTWTALDVCGNTTEYVQIITVIDTSAPAFTLTPADITIQCSDSILPADTNGPATATDNCGVDPNQPISYVDVDNLGGCNGTGSITRTWTALDACGNTAKYVQTITVIDTIAPSFILTPADITIQCDDSVDPVDTNGPATASDNCGMDPNEPISYTDIDDLGGCNGTGTITRTWTALDTCGNTTEYVQLINVIDTTVPTIQCPDPYNVDNDPNECTAVVTLGATAADNCTASPQISYAIESDPNSGDFNTPILHSYAFPVGTTVVQALAEDDCTNLSEPCTFLVTVNDAELPVITSCPPDVTVTNYDGECAELVWFDEALAADNCPGVSVAYAIESVPDSGSFDTSITRLHIFPVGTTTVQTTAIDAAMNVINCTFKVTVIEEIPPVIYDCPANITVNDGGTGSVAVSWTPPTADDNCGTPSLTSTHDPNDTFPVGTTTVTYTAEDSAGNTATCNFDVMVNPINELAVTVELQPLVSSPLIRCITFELWDCGGSSSVEIEQELLFTDGLASDTLIIPAGSYECITARDGLHTLRRTDEDFHVVGNQYIADFTGDPNSGDDRLIGGNVYYSEWIDMYDYGVLVGEWSEPPYGSGDTTCATTGWHADVNGDGYVFVEDFSFIQINYLAGDEANCCRGRAPRTEPATLLVVSELAEAGLAHLAAADLDGNGLLEAREIATFANVSKYKGTGIHHTLTTGSHSLRGTPAIELEWRPQQQSVAIGETVEVGLYAVYVEAPPIYGPDISAMSVILQWDPNALELQGNSDGVEYEWLSSGFANDPYGLNDNWLDGNALYVAMSQLESAPASATTGGLLVTTLQFEALADATVTLAIPEQSGQAGTKVLTADQPNTDVHAALGSALITIGTGGRQLGDMNCDGSVNSLDIDPFVLALSATPPGYSEYYAEHPDCDHLLGDVNADGSLNSLDIDPFVQLLSGS